jgi:alkaline phosphatase
MMSSGTYNRRRAPIAAAIALALAAGIAAPLAAAPAAKAKYVFLFIGDGMAMPQIAATEA